MDQEALHIKIKIKTKGDRGGWGTQGGLLEDGDEMGVVLFFLPEGAPAKADQWEYIEKRNITCRSSWTEQQHFVNIFLFYYSISD